MKKINSKEVLAQCIGQNFIPIGPFLVVDLTSNNELFERLRVGTHNMEQVSRNEKTKNHSHTFPSFYKSEGLNIENNGELYELPERALTLVLPGDDHSWLPKRHSGKVGSVDSRHRKQVVVAA